MMISHLAGWRRAEGSRARVVDGPGRARRRSVALRLRSVAVPVPINTSPRTGLNATLMQVGATYHVFHFCYPPGTCQTKVPSNDANHWSYNGH
jgi:hypothetical protein